MLTACEGIQKALLQIPSNLLADRAYCIKKKTNKKPPC